MAGHRRSVVLSVVVSLVAAAIVGLHPLPAQALSTAPDQTWMVNGTVYGLAYANRVLYVGAKFTKVLDQDGVFQYRASTRSLGSPIARSTP